MALVVAALWKAKLGEEDRVEKLLETMTGLSRLEPGCLFYQGHRSLDDPRLFFVYEQYADQAANEAHRASSHFKRYVDGEAGALLEHRERSIYRTLDLDEDAEHRV